MDRKDNKLTLVKLKYLLKNFRKLKDIEKLPLLETGQDFFHLVENIENATIKNIKISGRLKTLYGKQELQPVNRSKLTFYSNLRFPDENRKLHSYRKLTKKAAKLYLAKYFPCTKTK